MTRTARSACLSVILLASSAPLHGSDAPLAADLTIVRGKLDNGLSYLIRQHAVPPGKMALLLYVDTGSLNETDAQKGLAHFLEHMAFNGSENFPPGKLVEYFESIGMEFGDDLNAFTSFDQTAYMLFTPGVTQAELDKAMLCLSDQAFRLLLTEEEIEKERGVILEETRSGKSPEQRIRDTLYPRLFPGSRFADRMPIGDEKLVATFPRQEFVEYYRKWYRPDAMMLILVGDAAPQELVPLIEKHFGSYKVDTPRPQSPGGQIGRFETARALVVSDPEIATAEVEMMNVAAGRPPVTTEDRFREELVERLGSWIVGRRLEEMVQKGEAAFRSGSVSARNFFNEVTLVYGGVFGEPGDWAKMLDQLIVTVNRACEHGFTERELEQAKRETLANAERAVERESTRPARAFLRSYGSSINDGDTIQSAQQELDLYKKFLPEITLRQINEAFAKNFAPGTFAYVLTLPQREELKLPPEDEVLAAARSALARKTEPVVDQQRPDSLLAELPAPGKVVEQTRDEDLGITCAWLENGVRVHHRYMDYHKDTVLVSISLAGGNIEETAENRGITEVATLVFNQPATGRLTSTDVRDLTTGKNFSLRGGDLPDRVAIRITGSPKDLETAFQLAHALLVDGRIEPSAFDNWRKQKLQSLEAGKTDPQFQLAKAVMDVLSGTDPRLKILTAAQVEAQNREAAQTGLERMCRQAPIEVAIVGDLELAPAMELVTRYLGSLPERPRRAEKIDALRALARGPGPHEKVVTFEGMTPMAVTFAGFLSCEEAAVADRRSMALAANVLTTRMIKDIREEKRLVYSIRATSQPSTAYRDSGLFFGVAPTDPGKGAQLADEVLAAVNAFAKDGPTEPELDVAKRQIANDLDTERKEPAYWHGELADFDFHGKSLKDLKEEDTAYQALTAAEVKAVFNRYHTPQRIVRIVVTPAQSPSETMEPATTTAPAS